MALDLFWTTNEIFTAAPSSLRIINIYNRQTSKTTRSISPAALFRSYDKPTVICGDFNIHNNIADPLRICSVEETNLSTPYFDLAHEHKFNMLNTPGSYTRYPDSPAHRPSVIDLAFANAALGQWHPTWRNNLPKSGSDHTTISIEIDLNKQKIDRPKEVFNWSQTNWNNITESLQKLTLNPVYYPIDHWFDSQLHSINALLESNTPHKRISAWSKPWWSPHLSNLRRIYHSIARMHKKALAPLFMLKSSKNAYFKAIQKAKTDHWNDKVAHANSKDLWSLKALLTKDKTQKMPAFQGALTPLDTNSAMINHFFPKPSISHPTPPQGWFPDTPPITTDEITKALNASSNNNAPGPDTKPCLVWKQIHKINPNLLPTLFTPLISSGHHPISLKHAFGVVLAKPKKPDYNSPAAYRIIVLLETISKIIERIITYRLFKHARSSNMIHQNQTGSIAGLSTADAAHTLIHEVRLLQRAGLKVSTLFLDIKGGFDNILPSVLSNTLAQHNTPSYMISWIMSFLSDRTCTLLFPGGPRLPMKVQVGAPQDSPISPLLFCIYVKPLHNDPCPGITISYVDDFAITVASPSHKDNVPLLQNAHASAVVIGKNRNTDFSLPKTEFIHWRLQVDNSPVATDPIKLRQHTFHPGKTVKWLGYWFTPNLSPKHHFSNRIAITKAALFNFYKLSTPGKGLTPLNNRKLAIMALLPLLTYGASVFTPNTSTMDDLKVCWNKILRWVTNCFYSTPTDLLCLEASFPPFHLYFNSLKIRYACRLLLALPEQNPAAARFPHTFPALSNFRAPSHRHLLRKRPNPPVNWDSSKKGVPRLPIDELCSSLIPALQTGSQHHKLALEAKHQVFNAWQALSSTPVSHKPSFILQLPRFVAGRIIQMRCGKSYLAAHKSWFNKDDPSLCPRCEEEDETLEHAILQCPARDTQRALFLPTANTLDEIWADQSLTSALGQYIIATRTGFPPSADSQKSPPYELDSQSSLTSISKLSLNEEEDEEEE